MHNNSTIPVMSPIVEYKVVLQEYRGESLAPECLQAELNAYGQEGWECIQLLGYKTPYILVLKRYSVTPLSKLVIQADDDPIEIDVQGLEGDPLA